MPTNRNSNNDIWTASDAVAKALLESPEFLEVERTRRQLGEDEETREILWKYQTAKKEIHDARERGGVVADKVLKDSKRLKKALANDSTVQAHERAKGAFQELLRKTNLALSTALGGIDFGELALSTDE